MADVYESETDTSLARVLEGLHDVVQKHSAGSLFERELSYRVASLNRANLKDAEMLLKNILQADASWVAADILLGFLYSAKEEWAKAVEHFQRGISGCSLFEKAHIYFELARAQWNLPDRAGAEASYRQCLALQEDFEYANNYLGEVLYEQRKYAEALIYLDRAIELSEDGFHPYATKLEVLKKMKRFNEAAAFIARSRAKGFLTLKKYEDEMVSLALKDKENEVPLGEALESQKEFSIGSINEPVLFLRNQKQCYLDPVMKVLRIKTPEEEVRQKLLHYLHEELQIPYSAISVETPMSHHCKGGRGRADIIIYNEDSHGKNKVPVAVIECKAPGVFLVDAVYDQVYNYARQLEVPLVGVTNGDTLNMRYLDLQTGKYSEVIMLPDYETMCDASQLHLAPYVEPEWNQFQFEDIFNPEAHEQALDLAYIGEVTPIEYRPHLMNLLIGLLYSKNDARYTLHVEGYTFVKDIGIRFASFGNASGGSYPGYYRAFLFTDASGNSQIISIGLFGTAGEYTSLVVAVDDFDTHHNTLQLNVNKSLVLSGNQAMVYHNGSLSVSNKGSVKPADVIALIRSKNSKMVQGNRVYLGAWDVSQPLNTSNASFRDFLERIISYAFLRDEYRKEYLSR